MAKRYPRTNRFNGRCRACGTKHSRKQVALVDDGTDRYVETVEDLLPVGGLGHPILTCSCGKRLYLKRVVGKTNTAIECDARCMSAIGHTCECACGGLNHGASHGC